MILDDRWLVLKEISEGLGKSAYVEEGKYCIINVLDNTFIKLRAAGKKAIDICKVNNNFQEPNKYDAVSQIMKHYDLAANNIIFFGNEVDKDERDSILKRYQCTEASLVLGVGKHNKNELEKGVKLLSDIFVCKGNKRNGDQVYNILNFINKYLEENLSVNNDLATVLYKCFESLNINHKLISKKHIFLCFDIDDTLLDHRINDDNKRETFAKERIETARCLVELWQKGLGIAFISDNDYSRVYSRIINPIIELIRDKDDFDKNLIPISIFANGSTKLSKLYSDTSIEDDYEYSVPYILNKEIIAKIEEVIGEVVEGKGNEVLCRGILGKYYRKVTDNTTCPSVPKKDGYVSLYYPKYKLTKSSFTCQGNFKPPYLEKRHSNKEDITQLSIKPILSKCFI
ncbi:hypothetical protein [uncultured Clostridium sp.]|uniref:hypothetical protein n=1 Tax=uncultured Clostridium sp. TaxID=59620 RepID=UPI0025D4470C|nr:hypothetical protein [uncultured Clostridium sp.]